jgi:hypothetical protein
MPHKEDQQRNKRKTMKNVIEGTVLNESIIGIPADQLEKHRNNLDAFGESYIRITAKTDKTESIATILKRKGVLHNATIDSSKFHNAMLCARCGCECKKEIKE